MGRNFRIYGRIVKKGNSKYMFTANKGVQNDCVHIKTYGLGYWDLEWFPLPLIFKVPLLLLL